MGTGKVLWSFILVRVLFFFLFRSFSYKVRCFFLGSFLTTVGDGDGNGNGGCAADPEPACGQLHMNLNLNLTGTFDFDDLRDYARRLLGSFPDPRARGVRIKLPAEAISPVPQRTPTTMGAGAGEERPEYSVGAEEEKRMEREMEREMERAEGGLSGCREAVEILTRNPKKGVSCRLPFSEWADRCA